MKGIGIFKAIQKSIGLMDLKNNWDSNGALPMNKKTYIKAMEFLLKIVDNINVDIKTEECDIRLRQDGDVEIHFHGNKSHLSIHANSNGISYEGEGPSENDKIKTINNSGGFVSEEVFDWLDRNFKKSA